MLDISHRLYKAIRKHLDRDISFFDLLELAQKEDPKIFIEANLEGIDMKKILLYNLLNTWTYSLTYERLQPERMLGKRSYNVILHLFEKEDFLELCPKGFKDFWDVVHDLRFEEQKVCGQYYSEYRVFFEKIYNAIIRRCQVSLKPEIS